MHPPRRRLLRRNEVIAMHGADFFHFCRVQPFRVSAKGAPDFVFIHRRHVQAAFGQGRGDRRPRHVFGVWQRVALNKTVWQVAAKQGLQLPGDIFKHRHSSASAKADAAFPSGVAKPYLRGTQFFKQERLERCCLTSPVSQQQAGLPERTHSPVQERCGIGIHEASGK